MKLLDAKPAAGAVAAIISAAAPSKRRSSIGGVSGFQSANRSSVPKISGPAAVGQPQVWHAGPTAPVAARKVAAKQCTTTEYSKGNAPFAGNKDYDSSGRMITVLQRLTEEYGDRVGERGGGTSSGRFRNTSATASGGGGTGGGRTGPAADRKRANAAALIVQRAFRVRMFHRFVWAQAYLRRPMHAFRLFKRVSRPIIGASCAPFADMSTFDGDPGPSQHCDGGKILFGAARDPVTSIDTWSEPPGFCVSSPRHMHSADLAFWAYSRWRRDSLKISVMAGGEEDYIADGVPKVADCTVMQSGRVMGSGVKHRQSAVPTASASTRAGGVAAATSVGTAVDPTETEHARAPPPFGSYLFERKYEIRKEAVRVLLLDLRLPLAVGALDVAIEHLESILTAEATPSDEPCLVKGNVGSRTCGATEGGGGGTRGRGHVKNLLALGRYFGISFVTFYQWWVRHLPYDLTTAACLVKTVRCARALHTAEIATGGF